MRSSSNGPPIYQGNSRHDHDDSLFGSNIQNAKSGSNIVGNYMSDVNKGSSKNKA